MGGGGVVLIGRGVNKDKYGMSEGFANQIHPYECLMNLSFTSEMPTTL